MTPKLVLRINDDETQKRVLIESQNGFEIFLQVFFHQKKRS